MAGGKTAPASHTPKNQTVTANRSYDCVVSKHHVNGGAVPLNVLYGKGGSRTYSEDTVGCQGALSRGYFKRLVPLVVVGLSFHAPTERAKERKKWETGYV